MNRFPLNSPPVPLYKGRSCLAFPSYPSFVKRGKGEFATEFINQSTYPADGDDDSFAVGSRIVKVLRFLIGSSVLWANIFPHFPMRVKHYHHLGAIDSFVFLCYQ